ncbi:hypothetical protein [Metabacillus halosaccharovorans]|uniref:hypothetical protein n=1 Tax=Metabacillus halosaccharovorans TaxID=930124 RepID=UPI000995B7D4|nr:hypothetical protein [Metabacillus halosaccharovorans]
MEKKPPSVDFQNYDYYFVSIFESGSCPYNLTKTTVNSYIGEIVFYLTGNYSGNCTSDASPRTFVIEINKAIAVNMKRAAIVYHNSWAEDRTTERIIE